MRPNFWLLQSSSVSIANREAGDVPGSLESCENLEPRKRNLRITSVFCLPIGYFINCVFACVYRRRPCQQSISQIQRDSIRIFLIFFRNLRRVKPCVSFLNVDMIPELLIQTKSCMIIINKSVSAVMDMSRNIKRLPSNHRKSVFW